MPVVVPTGGLSTAALAQWLVDQGVDWTLVPGPKVPDTPDRLTVVTRVGGAGFLLEQALDSINFQLRTRGAQADPGDAEAMANLLDWLITSGGGAGFPLTIGGTPVAVMGRTGGPPAPLGPSDNGDRQTVTCTYYANVASFI